jgi:hypothetical protein
MNRPSQVENRPVSGRFDHKSGHKITTRTRRLFSRILRLQAPVVGRGLGAFRTLGVFDCSVRRDRAPSARVTSSISEVFKRHGVAQAQRSEIARLKWSTMTAKQRAARVSAARAAGRGLERNVGELKR